MVDSTCLWKPIAVALVSSGSPGNKLLFYHNDLFHHIIATGLSHDRSHDLDPFLRSYERGWVPGMTSLAYVAVHFAYEEVGWCHTYTCFVQVLQQGGWGCRVTSQAKGSKLPRRTIAEILAPCSAMKDRKFELKVDNWKFVGHPFSFQTPSWFVSCNIAFILQSVCSSDDVRAYDNMSRALGAAVLHEEYRNNFLKSQVELLMHISEEVDSINELSAKAVQSSSLAKTLQEVLIGLQKGNPHVHVWVNGWSEVSLLVNTDKPLPATTATIGQSVAQQLVRSYSAVLLLKDLCSLPASCNPSFDRFLNTISPVKSLHQVALDADIPLQQAIKFASHLVYWGQAMSVYPLSETNIYINSPTADTSRKGVVSQEFSETFADADTCLPLVLGHFSSPITLAEMREIFPDEKLIPIVTWLLKHEQIIQLHTYIYLVPPESNYEAETHSHSAISKDIMDELQVHLSETEIRWVLTTAATENEEDLLEFTRLCCYFHGNHHLEEILMLENMTRSQLLTLIDKFSEILTTVSLTEHTLE